MPKVWEPARKEELLARLEALQPDTRAKWGKFTPSRMLMHCANGMEAGLGELKLTPRNGPLRFWILKKLIIYVAPWPHGAPTAPELIPDGEPDFALAKTAFEASLNRFIAAGPKGKFVPHAAFGELTPGDWGALTYRHIDHHWRQFGL